MPASAPVAAGDGGVSDGRDVLHAGVSTMTTESLAALPVLDLEGTPARIGESHGEALRERIAAHAECHYQWLMEGVALRLDEAGLRALWAPRLVANETAAPEL